MPNGWALPYLLSPWTNGSGTRQISQYVHNVIPAPQHHAIEEHTVCGGKAPYIMNLDISWSMMSILGRLEKRNRYISRPISSIRLEELRKTKKIAEFQIV